MGFWYFIILDVYWVVFILWGGRVSLIDWYEWWRYCCFGFGCVFVWFFIVILKVIDFELFGVRDLEKAKCKSDFWNVWLGYFILGSIYLFKCYSCFIIFRVDFFWLIWNLCVYICCYFIVCVVCLGNYWGRLIE